MKGVEKSPADRKRARVQELTTALEELSVVPDREHPAHAMMRTSRMAAITAELGVVRSAIVGDQHG